MEYYIKTSNIDGVTAAMMRTYDKDGDGVFDKDLRGAMKSNEQLDASSSHFKRLFIVAILFCVLLLTSMVAISYAVAILTANTQVRSDVTLLSKVTAISISTANSPNLFVIYSVSSTHLLSPLTSFK